MPLFNVHAVPIMDGAFGVVYRLLDDNPRLNDWPQSSVPATSPKKLRRVYIAPLKQSKMPAASSGTSEQISNYVALATLQDLP